MKTSQTKAKGQRVDEMLGKSTRLLSHVNEYIEIKYIKT
jgi:hypothetical protein